MGQAWTLSRQLVDTGVDFDLHAFAADGSLGDADNVIPVRRNCQRAHDAKLAPVQS
jgi:hypothetical protein